MSDDIAGLSFEDAMAQLEAIVRDLESGKGKLDDAVGAYDRGVRLRRHCDAKLAEAQAKIDKIVAGPNGAVGTEPFDAQS